MQFFLFLEIKNTSHEVLTFILDDSARIKHRGTKQIRANKFNNQIQKTRIDTLVHSFLCPLQEGPSKK